MARSIPWADDDAGARAKFTQGHAWQRLPFEYFRAQGLAVEMPDLAIRQNYGDRHRFKNQVDLWVNGQRVEVKSVPVTFTDARSYPFGSVIVDEVKKFNGKTPTPLAYVFVSQPTGAMLCTRTDLPGRFGVRRGVRDKVRDIVIDVYTVQKDRLVTLDVLTGYLRQLGAAPVAVVTTASQADVDAVLQDIGRQAFGIDYDDRGRAIRP